MLADVVDTAVFADSCFQSAPVEWQIQFADPATGKTFGFPYEGADRCLTREEKIHEVHLMDVHVEQSTNKKRAIGRPVDHIVRPLLLGYTLSRRTCTWDRRSKMSPMEVVVDMGWGESGDEGGEEVEEAEAETDDAGGGNGEDEDEGEENTGGKVSA
ncbi:hypothetical protein B0I37DRAFT_195560 [Chaetomium sp. MPI-CAGE-AT-0009]|nr:hypothetical protein B0I37DRAFT_195560 [Chaetomium sp. MPI-CAGE-AT-0009]